MVSDIQTLPALFQKVYYRQRVLDSSIYHLDTDLFAEGIEANRIAWLRDRGEYWQIEHRHGDDDDEMSVGVDTILSDDEARRTRIEELCVALGPFCDPTMKARLSTYVELVDGNIASVKVKVKVRLAPAR